MPFSQYLPYSGKKYHHINYTLWRLNVNPNLLRTPYILEKLYIPTSGYYSFKFDFDVSGDYYLYSQYLNEAGLIYYSIAMTETIVFLKVEDSDKKQLLIDLAEMEDEHEATFKSLRSQLSMDEKIQTTFDPEGDSERYLRALADTRVFYEKDVDTTSFKGILKSAITAEKDSIVFYLGMKDVVPANLGKEKLDDIIKEEMGHIRLLSNELMELKK